MRYIKNAEALARSELRTHILDLVETAYASIDTERVLRDKVRLVGDTLTVGDAQYHLPLYERIFVVGCGKIACQAAGILESILHEQIDDGAVIGLTSHVCDVVTSYQGTHPLPSIQNFSAAEHIVRIGSEVTERDLVLVIVGGGGSALLCYSQGECDETARLYEAFLNSGGTIDEHNIVRRHLSPLKGGGLAKALYPATVVGLIFSDVVGGDLSIVASGPTYKDETTIADAQAIIDKYGLGAFTLTETPKDDIYFEKVNNVLMLSNAVALEAMAEAARSFGLEPVFSRAEPYAFPEDMVGTMMEEARPGTVVLMGGETRLKIPEGAKGQGGRNTYLALEAVERVNGAQGFVSFASDGHDNADAAGALVDEMTKATIDEQGLNIDEYRRERDSTTLFSKTGDLIVTGHIDSNVSDLMVLITRT